MDTAEEKGYDGGKKISGIKLHIVVDTLGLPHALLVTPANVGDRSGAEDMISMNLDSLSAVLKFMVDGGYTGDDFAESIKKMMGAKVEVVKRNELHQFVVLPKRWIVERSFGWLEKSRRLWKKRQSAEVLKTSGTAGSLTICIRRRCAGPERTGWWG